MRQLAAGVAALGAIACAEPGEAFIGRWNGTYECIGRWDNDDIYEEGPATQSIRIDRDINGELYQSGDCALPLEVVSAARLDYVPTECSTILPSGLPITANVDSGNMVLSGGALGYEVNVHVEFDDGSGYFYDARCSMRGGLPAE